MAIDQETKAIAVNFIKAFAADVQYFNGGTVLAAFRESGLPGADLDWRNTWGALISSCAKKGWFIRAGRVAPESPQSHTATLVQWESRLFRGVPSLSGVTVHEQLVNLRKAVFLRKMDLMTALQKAFNLGAELQSLKENINDCT